MEWLFGWLVGVEEGRVMLGGREGGVLHTNEVEGELTNTGSMKQSWAALDTTVRSSRLCMTPVKHSPAAFSFPDSN